MEEGLFIKKEEASEGDIWLRSWAQEEVSEPVMKYETVKEEEDMDVESIGDEEEMVDEDQDFEEDEPHESDVEDSSQKDLERPQKRRGCKNKCPCVKHKGRDLIDRYREVVGNARVAEDGSAFGCVFKCPEGDFKTFRIMSLRRHFKESGHAKMLCSLHDAVRFLKRTSSFTCRICDGKELYEPLLIQTHLKWEHRMSTSQYRERFKISRPRKRPDWYRRGDQMEIEEIVNGAEISREPRNACVFSCGKCDFETSTQTSLKDHFKTSMHEPMRLQQNGIFKYLKKAVCHVCSLCSQKVLCDNTALTVHMRFKHSLNLSEYRSMLGLTFNIKPKAPERSKIKKLQLEEMIREAQVSDEVSACAFVCRQCDVRFDSFVRIKRHFCKSKHGPQDFSMHDIVDFISVAACHVCKICSTKLLCDRAFIQIHLTSRHNKCKMSDYERHHLGKSDPKIRISEKVTREQVDSEKHAIESGEISDKWLNQCLFACPKCTYTTNTFGKLRQHFLEAQHGDETLPDQGLVKFMTKAVCHICRICSEKILCETSALGKHLLKHGLGPRKYRREHLEMMNCVSTDKVGNLCTFSYKCCKCSTLFEYPCQLGEHMKSCIDQDLKVYSNAFTKFMVKPVYHDCVLCSERLLCNLAQLQKHMKSSHNIDSILEYCQKTGCKFVGQEHRSCKAPKCGDIENRCQFQCQSCSYNSGSWRHFKNHLHEKHQVQKKVINLPILYVVSPVFFDCSICGESILCDKTLIEQHTESKHRTCRTQSTRLNLEQAYNVKLKGLVEEVPKCPKQPKTLLALGELEGKTTIHIGNFCTFKCTFCPTESTSWIVLRKHMKAKHGFGLKAGDINVITTWAFHQCVICQRAVLCDKHFVSTHILTHKRKFSEYKATVVKFGGKVMPSLREYMAEQEGRKPEQGSQL